MIVGCGELGKLCIETLLPLGFKNFFLIDKMRRPLGPDHPNYDPRIDEIESHSKVDICKNLILNHDKNANIITEENGVRVQDLSPSCAWADLIFDNVGIHTRNGICAKLWIHRTAMYSRKPVIMPISINQQLWIKTYDYRNPKLAILDGFYKEIEYAQTPVHTLLGPLLSVFSLKLETAEALLAVMNKKFIDPYSMKHEMITEHHWDLKNSTHLLPSLLTPLMLYYLKYGKLAAEMKTELRSEDESPSLKSRASRFIKTQKIRKKLLEELRKNP